MSTTEAAAAPATQETQETQDKMSVDEQQQSKAEEKKEEEKKEEGGEKKDEEKKEGVTPRRSTRISATASTAPANNGTPTKVKRGPGRPAKKRSADDVAEAEGTDGKPKKAKKAEEAEGLKLGEPLPDLVLKNEQGEEVKVQNLAENKKGVVLFLVPKADTPGCTTQACGFRDINSEFASLDFEVYCLSADAPDKQKKWKDKKSLPFPLLSDPERKLVEKLTGSAAKTPRSHFVFAGGKLVDKRMPVKPVDSPRLALEFIKALEVGKTGDPGAIKETDHAGVAAASAAASAAVVPAEAPAVAAAPDKEENGPAAAAAETAAAS